MADIEADEEKETAPAVREEDVQDLSTLFDENGRIQIFRLKGTSKARTKWSSCLEDW